MALTPNAKFCLRGSRVLCRGQCLHRPGNVTTAAKSTERSRPFPTNDLYVRCRTVEILPWFVGEGHGPPGYVPATAKSPGGACPSPTNTLYAGHGYLPPIASLVKGRWPSAVRSEGLRKGYMPLINGSLPHAIPRSPLSPPLTRGPFLRPAQNLCLRGSRVLCRGRCLHRPGGVPAAARPRGTVKTVPYKWFVRALSFR